VPALTQTLENAEGKGQKAEAWNALSITNHSLASDDGALTKPNGWPALLLSAFCPLP
jgi:hypothetical protein